MKLLPVRFLTSVAVVVAMLLSSAWAQAPLIIVHDLVRGHENNTRENTCVPANRFSGEQQVIWRIKVMDPTTGMAMGLDALEAVRIVMPDGEVFEAEYGPHPAREPVDDYWTYDWIVPADYPTGLVDFTIEAVAMDGRTGTMVMFPIETSMLTIVAAE